jgi:hypothetical protein
MDLHFFDGLEPMLVFKLALVVILTVVAAPISALSMAGAPQQITASQLFPSTQ